ncbi:MAG: hypothetical protein ACP5E4_00995 [Candidatus Aenigmatarchaeota archaeon]
MVEAPLAILLKMISLVFWSAVEIVASLFALFVELLNSLAYIIQIAGPLGVIMSVTILVPVIYVISKVFTGELKAILIAGSILFFVIVMISAFA